MRVLPQVVRTGIEVGVDEGGCSPTRARARCACRSSWIWPAVSTPATPAIAAKEGSRCGRSQRRTVEGVEMRPFGEERVNRSRGSRPCSWLNRRTRRGADWPGLACSLRTRSRSVATRARMAVCRHCAMARRPPPTLDARRSTLGPMIPGQEMPLRTAWTAAWMRLSRWSFARMLAMWLWTVLVLSESSCAMS